MNRERPRRPGPRGRIRSICRLASCTVPLLASLACAGASDVPRKALGLAPGASWDFFAASPDDVWSDKIVDWQRRQRAQGTALADPERPAPRNVLRAADYALLVDQSDAFLVRERRALAGRILAFSLKEARRHFKWDPATDLAGDPWPTSRELYARNGDDCDGLDLIAYDLLVAFGFPKDALYRVVVRRERDGAHHMATLWFDDRDDPFVVDATGAISRRLVRFSTLRGWTPLRVFDEDERYGVAPRP